MHYQHRAAQGGNGLFDVDFFDCVYETAADVKGTTGYLYCGLAIAGNRAELTGLHVAQDMLEVGWCADRGHCSNAWHLCGGRNSCCAAQAMPDEERRRHTCLSHCDSGCSKVFDV